MKRLLIVALLAASLSGTPLDKPHDGIPVDPLDPAIGRTITAIPGSTWIAFLEDLIWGGDTDYDDASAEVHFSILGEIAWLGGRSAFLLVNRIGVLGTAAEVGAGDGPESFSYVPYSEIVLYALSPQAIPAWYSGDGSLNGDGVPHFWVECVSGCDAPVPEPASWALLGGGLLGLGWFRRR